MDSDGNSGIQLEFLVAPWPRAQLCSVPKLALTAVEPQTLCSDQGSAAFCRGQERGQWKFGFLGEDFCMLSGRNQRGSPRMLICCFLSIKHTNHIKPHSFLWPRAYLGWWWFIPWAPGIWIFRTGSRLTKPDICRSWLMNRHGSDTNHHYTLVQPENLECPRLKAILRSGPSMGSVPIPSYTLIIYDL